MATIDPQKPSTPPPRIAPLLVGIAIAGLLVGVVAEEWRWRSAQPLAGGPLEIAEQAFRHDDDKAAVVLFDKLAAEGNANAQYWLAHMTELGLGAPRDPARAIDLYKKAAAQDMAAAQLRLGEIYLHGNLALPDFVQAESYLEKAAYHGSTQAAMLLGQMYRVGLNGPPNPIEAYAWSEVATLEGSAFAKRERDASFGDLSADDRQKAVGRAQDILHGITNAPVTPALPPPQPK